MIEIVAETSSTNEDLLRRLKAGEYIAEGYWLVADRQTAGRGRQGREWNDGAGNFMGSTVVIPGASDPPPPTLALMTGLALFDAVLPLVSPAQKLSLKWPNDLMLDGAKLAGILLERHGNNVVVGIGVNLASAPKLGDRKTAFLAQSGSAADRDVFAAALASSFSTELVRWRDAGLEPLLRRWQSAAHAVGSPLGVHECDGTVIRGEFAGLDSDGALLLRLANGEMRTIHAGDVMLADGE